MREVHFRLTQLQNEVEMSPAKVHRYLVSLIETGLVTRLKEPGLYDLGPKALKLGFKAIQAYRPGSR